MGEIYSFKGDNINGYDPTERAWDPNRLLSGYWHSCATLNFLRGMQQGAVPAAISKAPEREHRFACGLGPYR